MPRARCCARTASSAGRAIERGAAPVIAGTRWLCYCRAGFERECAQELMAWASSRGIEAGTHGEPGSAAVLVELAAPSPPPPWSALVFARQSLAVIEDFPELDAKDRLSPLLASLERTGGRWRDVWVETPDSTAGAELKAFCRSFEAALVGALRKRVLLSDQAPNRLHVCFRGFRSAWLAYSDPALAAPWPGGIPRLKVPREAPSRSAAKIEEAWLTLLDERERGQWLAPGRTAVDLGAAPGGWSWQLARKGVRVTAVDNGPLRPNVLDTGLVAHMRADGFRFRPKKNVDWLVCDMVEQPRRIATLVGAWLAEGLARAALFNLKLPMKRRYDELHLCLDGLTSTLSTAGRSMELRAKQLYHDREEVTVVALPLARQGRRSAGG